VTTARALHGAVRVPDLVAPNDTVHFRVFYPALFSGSDAERLSGEIPFDPDHTPFPVVLVLPGMNIGPEGYRWLAQDLVARGCAVVTFALIGETRPGVVGISPGLDLDALTPETYGSRPSAIAVGPLLDALRSLNSDGLLQGAFDLDRVVLGGHSAGGTVALLNADPTWFPGVVGVWSFAAHTMASTVLGWQPETVLQTPSSVPTLLLGAGNDGVIARSADRYGRDAGPDHDPIARTFAEALHHGGGDQRYAVASGALHTSLLHPHDPTSARGFLDGTAGRDPIEIRADLAGAIGEFVDAYATGRPGAIPLLDERLARWAVFEKA
jgi:alpha-beta hydrolase superfamily lysophospholipase